MSEASDYRYVRSVDGTSIAYHVSGEGSIDFVFIGGQAVDLWDDPGFGRFARHLGVQLRPHLLDAWERLGRL